MLCGEQSQKTLKDFIKEPIEVKSATSDRVYEVRLQPPQCQCDFFRFNGGKGKLCRHILEKKLEEMMGRMEYLEFRRNQLSDERVFEDFEMVMSYFEFGGSEEFQILCSMVLSLAIAKGEVNSDEIYEMVGGKFQHNFRILGTVWGSLKRRGWIIDVRMMRSERPENHSRKFMVYVLTDKARHLLPEGKFAPRQGGDQDAI